MKPELCNLTDIEENGTRLVPVVGREVRVRLTPNDSNVDGNADLPTAIDGDGFFSILGEAA